ncbi:hypothetical protein B0H63DRAFT_474747 [Podospora didyma]|uniref:Secreted protein n=1 Tax=Podospora didyma TaxID=330526 RepID=A0AAE0TVF7_9PEZI|nr:hypothetical protein B0H63DRAFT_474747 [Podospora didyma]
MAVVVTLVVVEVCGFGCGGGQRDGSGASPNAPSKVGFSSTWRLGGIEGDQRALTIFLAGGVDGAVVERYTFLVGLFWGWSLMSI